MNQNSKKGEVKKLKALYRPRRFQKEVHLHLKRFNVLVCHRRFGKRCDVLTPIPTPEGFKLLKDIVDGDTIFGHDGKPCVVKHAHPIELAPESYRVTFKDGRYVDCDKEHLWYVEKAMSRYSKNKRTIWECGETLNTKTILDRIDKGESLFVPVAGIVQYPEKELPVDPYVLGLWLGDGSKDNFLIVNPVQGIRDSFSREVHRLGDEASESNVNHPTYCARVISKKKEGSRIKSKVILKELGLLNNKHIPEIYKISSEFQRKELVRGLMDTDGTVAVEGSNIFDNCNEQLLDDLREILESLGTKVSKSQFSRKDSSTEYRLFFRSEFNPFKLDTRNLPLWRGRNDSFSRRKIISVVKVEPLEMRCLTVDDPKHVFLVGRSYIPTHNTVLTVNEIIDRGLTNPLRNPQYAYVAPTYKQAKQIAWQYFLDFTRHIPNVKANKGDLEVIIPRPWRKDPVTGESDPDHVKFLLIGSDNPDALRGLYLDGAVLDEYAQCDPIIWGQILRPALSDRKKIANDDGIFNDMVGRTLEPWAIFLGTPKGQNHFYRRYNQATGAMEYAAAYEAKYDLNYQIDKWVKFEKGLKLKEDTPTKERDAILEKQNKLTVKQYKRYRSYLAAKNWFSAIYRASETGVIGQTEIEEMTADLQPEEVEQELECSFTAAILGSYFGKILNDIQEQGRICDLPYDPQIPVSTFWDIGMKDKTTIWFRQKVGRFWHYIDYMEMEGKGVPEIVKELNKLDYNVTRHVWPHDGRVREFGTGVSRQETARRLGLSVHIQPKQSVEDRIEAIRLRLRLSKFDEKKCARGIECIFNYQKEYDSKLMMFKEKPKHDWSSHGTDSFGYSALDDQDDESFNKYNGEILTAVMDYNELEH